MSETGSPLRITYIGGPTALIEIAGLRLLTDPTFDTEGAEFRSGANVLQKTQDPAITAADLGHLDAVLLSHDHHFDNLDGAGRRLLATADRVITTRDAVARLGGNSVALAPWQSLDTPTEGGGALRVTGTPARHGPAHMDRGPVIGFVLEPSDESEQTVYISGDTVWYEGVAEVASRFSVTVAVLFMGAARVEAVGPWHLTFTAEEGVQAARALSRAAIVPLHYEGWKHFSESRGEIERIFAAAGMARRLIWLPSGTPIEVPAAS
jgi:L-ascorbate metabolism protein UlaG (beta-lactamase superfamily)